MDVSPLWFLSSVKQLESGWCWYWHWYCIQPMVEKYWKAWTTQLGWKICSNFYGALSSRSSPYHRWRKYGTQCTGRSNFILAIFILGPKWTVEMHDRGYNILDIPGLPILNWMVFHQSVRSFPVNFLISYRSFLTLFWKSYFRNEVAFEFHWRVWFKIHIRKWSK